MKHQQAVQILELLLKDSKVFLGLVLGRNAFPIVPQRYQMASLLNDLSHIDHEETMDTHEVLELVYKDSKVFQGIAANSGAYPFDNHGGEVRKLFGRILVALLDVPQNDMIDDIEIGEAPYSKYCTSCGDTPIYFLFDGYPCTSCGSIGRSYSRRLEKAVNNLHSLGATIEVIPAKQAAPPAEPLTAKACLIAVNAIIEKSMVDESPLPLDTVEEWSAREMQEALDWAKAWLASEGTDEEPMPPIHIVYELSAVWEISDDQLVEAIARVNDRIDPLYFADWTLGNVLETAEWAMKQARSHVTLEMPKCLADAYAAANAKAEQREADKTAESPETPAKTTKTKKA